MRTIYFILCFFLSFSATNILHSQEANWHHSPTPIQKPYNLIELIEMSNGSGVSKITIDDIQDPMLDYIDLYYNVYAKLYYKATDVNRPALLEEISLTVFISIEGTEAIGQTHSTTADTTDLNLDPNRDLSLKILQFNKNNYAPYNLYDLDSASLTVNLNQLTDLDTNLAKNIYLELIVERGRYFTGSNDTIIPKIITPNVNNELKKNEAAIIWEHAPQPSIYEIEWVHVPHPEPLNQFNFAYDFKENAVRVRTDKNFVPLSLIHDPGYIVVRGRVLRPLINHEESALLNQYSYTHWSIPDKNQYQDTVADYVIVIDYDSTTSISKTNWQYRSNYANQSKKKEVINFFDGTNRSRQKTTLLNDFKTSTIIDTNTSIDIGTTVIAGETYYDFSGKPVIQVIPAPIQDATEVGFQESINQFGSSKLLKGDYDGIGFYNKPQLNSLSNGAAQYYSTDNPDYNTSPSKYLPKANGYPYSRIEYMKDGSGRLKTEYGVGQEMALDASKNNRYAYAKPTPSELQSLFGTNIGFSTYYKKDILIDGNGVSNISYVDNQGRIVATSVAGVPEGRSNMVVLDTSGIEYTDNLMATGAEKFYESKGSYELNYPVFTTSTAPYRFEYSFDIEPYFACSNVDLCFDCRYKFTFQIVDEENDLILEAKDHELGFEHQSCFSDSFKLDTINYTKSGVVSSINGNVIEITLSAQKQYSIIKKLELLTDELQADAELYIDSADCSFKDLENFQEEELNFMDFTPCETDFAENDPCAEIEESLRRDFYYPSGFFVASSVITDTIAFHIYKRIMLVFGCSDLLSYHTKESFNTEFINHFNLKGYPTFQNFETKYVDFFMKFHPSLCLLHGCRYFNNESSVRFDAILNESDSIEEFNNIARGLGMMSTSDSLFFNPIDSSILSTDTSFTHDSVLFLVDTFLIDIFNNGPNPNGFFPPGFNNGISGSLVDELLRKSRKCILDSALSNPIKALARSYFLNYNGSCPNSNFSSSISEITSRIDGTLVDRWQVFKTLYKNAKASLYQEFINGTICTHNLGICNTLSPSYFKNPLVDPVAYLNQDYFVGNGPRASSQFEIGDPEAFADSVLREASSSKTLAIECYQLLLANDCIKLTDSAAFVDNIDSSQLVCSPFSYLDKNIYVTCDPLLINLASVLSPYKRHYKTPAGASFYKCSNNYQERYNCDDFVSNHNDFITTFGTSEVPDLISYADLSIHNSKQQRYKNWMNYHLGLNLSFKDYYYMAHSCAADGNPSLFGDTVNWSDSGKIAALKLALINKSSIYFKELGNTDLFTEINYGLLGTNYSVNQNTDFLGFGEIDLLNSQYDLFYLDSQKTRFNNLLDTLNQVFITIKDSLHALPDVEEDYLSTTMKVNVAPYKLVQGIDSVLIDRSYRYSNGTVWVRLVNQLDSSFYNDYYYHYEPYTRIYTLKDIDGFDSITPVFDQEDLHYVRLTMTSIGFDMLASTSESIAKAHRLGQVELNEYMGMGMFPLDQTCEDLKYFDAKVYAQMNYEAYRQAKIDTFIMDYKQFCLNQKENNKAFSNQLLNMTYESIEKQFTLYYYDQAGNMVMTIPPGGVNRSYPYNSDTIAKIAAYRAGSSSEVLPNHSKQSIYKYNSDNQVIRQYTPNGDTVRYWYDRAGRPTLSQNAKQKLTNAFSYTLYDEQSRVEETGEVVLNELSGKDWSQIHAVIIVQVLDSSLIKMDSVIRSKTRGYVTKTYYDSKVLTSHPSSFEQRNLRSRVATQAFYSYMDTTTSNENWEYAMHFSYDATGNVKNLLNDYYQEGTIINPEDRFKRLDYMYDVISGQVLQVYYQFGKKDAFYHRYSYDAENRITGVETSRDGIIWDHDAKYNYYLHGPLARVEIGEHKVQGIDYAYTLQGWLKAVNSGHFNYDMGNDQAKNNVFGEDAFGFALQYHENDYQSLLSDNPHLISSNMHSMNSDLYNGNIAAMTMHNQELTYGRAYIYDQLNRIRSMQEREINVDSLVWEDHDLPQGQYSYYDYDKNGNLTNLQRYDGESEQLMDDMVYHYINGTDKLAYVDDAVDDIAFTNDIDQQTSGNYAYDELGNLVADTAEGICRIKWYPNGKVHRVIRTSPTRHRPNLKFDYDAFGNRIKKNIHFVEDGKSFLRTVYYVRDLQGNLMATYEERDCNYYEAEDSLGRYYYQYTESYHHYTAVAIDSVGLTDVMDFLYGSFSQKQQLIDESYLNLSQIPHIRDSIMKYFTVEDYLNLYPDAVGRVLSIDPFTYAEYLFNNYPDQFINLMNDRNEVWMHYLIKTDSIDDFYNDVDSLYNAIYGSGYSCDFYMHKRQMLSSITDQTYLKNILRLANDVELEDLQTLLQDPNMAYSELTNMLLELQDSLQNGSQSSRVEELIRLINAQLMLMQLDGGDWDDLLSQIDFNPFYNALNSLPAPLNDRLNSILHHLICMDNSGFIDESSLFDYKLMTNLDWSSDQDGMLLKYFFHPNFAPSWLISLSASYLEGAYLKQWDIFFSSSHVVKDFVINSMLRQIGDARIISALTSLSSITKSILYQSEDIEHLAHYLRTYHPYQTILQNYYYDGLEAALAGLHHYSPYDYAKELEQYFGLDFGYLSNCQPDQVYLIAQSFDLYGNKRLGTMDAKIERKIEDTKFSRKLRAKEYELTDHLGNVMATVSDKKLHPQELATPGSQEIDTSLGFQADVTGRYDYYPFGMEIMSRSGDYTIVDYNTDVTKLLYNGLMESCNQYEVIPQLYSPGNPKTLDSIFCDIDTNLYGQPYVNGLRIDQYWEHQAWNGQHKIEFKVKLSLSELIGTIEPNGKYTIQFEVSSKGRRVFGISPSTGVESIAGDPDASLDQIRHSQIKLLTFNYTGIELDTMLVNGVISFNLRASWGESGQFWDNFAELKAIHVYQNIENTTVPFAMRNSEAYTYGFNGMERDDEMKGSGNSYDFGARIYDPRLGRWMSPDPMEAKYPSTSTYVYSRDNPILFVDPDGNEWVNVHTLRLAKLNGQLEKNPNSRKIKRQIRRETKKEARVNDYLTTLKNNDDALYNYIDNLKVEDQSGNERNVKVYVKSDPRLKGNKGQLAETSRKRYTDKPNVKYGDKEIVAPRSDKGTPSFEVTIYGKSSYGDERLSNEAGDVMYYMEYNPKAVQSKSNSEYFEPGGGGMDEYLNSESGSYSNKVQDKYLERKNNGTGGEGGSNPYPLKE